MFTVRKHMIQEACTEALHDEIREICMTAHSVEELLCRWIRKGRAFQLGHFDFAPKAIMAVFQTESGESLIAIEWSLADIKKAFPKLEPVVTETLHNADDGGYVLDESWIDARNARIGAHWVKKDNCYELNPHFFVETALSYLLRIGGIARFTLTTPHSFERSEEYIALEASYMQNEGLEFLFQEHFFVPKRRLAARAKKLQKADLVEKEPTDLIQ